MAFTINQLTTRLRTSIGNPDTNNVPDSVLYENINDAIREILLKYSFKSGEQRATFSTVAGTANYSLPSGTEAIFQVWNQTRSERLYRLTSEQISQIVLPAVSGSAPVNYFRTPTGITLYPTPDAVYTIEVWGKLGYTALTTGQSMVLPDSWMPGVVKLARHYYYDGPGMDPAKAREAYGAWQLWANDAPTETELETDDAIMGVSVGVFERTTGKALDFDHEN